MASGASWVVVSRLPPRRNRRKRPKTTSHGTSPRCSPLTKPAFPPRREHVFPRNHASRGRCTRHRRIPKPCSRLGESTIFPESTPRGGFRVPFVASVVASGCPLCGRWSFCCALCAVGDHFWVSRVPSVVASRRHLCHRRSLPGARCGVSGRFGAPFVSLVVASGRPLCRWWSLPGALLAPQCHKGHM